MKTHAHAVIQCRQNEEILTGNILIDGRYTHKEVSCVSLHTSDALSMAAMILFFLLVCGGSLTVHGIPPARWSLVSAE